MKFTHATGSSDYISSAYIIRKAARAEWLVLDASETATLAIFPTYAAARAACEAGIASAPVAVEAEPAAEPALAPVAVAVETPAAPAPAPKQRTLGVGAWRERASDEHGRWDAEHSSGLRALIIRTPGHPPALWADLRRPHQMNLSNCPHYGDLIELAAQREARLLAQEHFAAALAEQPTPEGKVSLTLRADDILRVGDASIRVISLVGRAARLEVSAPGDVMRAESQHGVLIVASPARSLVSLNIYPTQNTLSLLTGRITLTVVSVEGGAARVEVTHPADSVVMVVGCATEQDVEGVSAEPAVPALPLITRTTLLNLNACAPGIAAWDVMGPDFTLDPNDKAAVVAALRGGLAPFWAWAVARGILPRDLTSANLPDANLYLANLYLANLYLANLTNANLPHANLPDANLYLANLTNANLTRADLYLANLTNANLTRADLTGANLTRADLTGAKYSEDTVWPDGFDPDAAGCVKVST